MKLLLDENLSARMLPGLLELFPESSHITFVGLEGNSDLTIWEFAKQNDFVIVSKDNDFRQRAFRFGPPPKVIWLSVGNASTSPILLMLQQNFRRIEDFCNQPDEAILALAI